MPKTSATRRRPFKLAMPVIREPVLHQQIAQVLRLEIAPPGKVSLDGVVWWSVDMAGYVGNVPGLRVARGCVAGLSDIDVLYRGLIYFIELKADDGSLSPAQQEIAHASVLAGARYGVARSADEVLALLDSWGIPRGRRVHTNARRTVAKQINDLI